METCLASLVDSIAVRTFEYQDIGAFGAFWIIQKGRASRTEIAAKNKTLVAAFGLDIRRAKNMASGLEAKLKTIL